MANDWNEHPFEDCLDALIDYRGKTPKKTISGIPLITAKIVKGGTISTPSEFIACEDYEGWMVRGFPEVGDVVMTTEAPLGEVAQLSNQNVALAQRIVTLRGRKEFLDNRFLKYSIISSYFQNQLTERATGSTVLGIKQKELRKISLRVPPLDEQKRIAHILGSLDDKIELNRQMNETLEAMAQALFKSWFVDFDPVIDNALAAGNEIPEEFAQRAKTRQERGDKRKELPEDIRQLFPSEFELTDEMEWIPKGWEVKSVEEALAVNPRVSLKKGEETLFADMKALPTSGFSISDTISKAYSGGTKFIQGDVLLARITPCLQNGKTGIVDFLQADEVGFGSTEFIVMRGKKGIKTSFVACLSRYPQFRQHCEQSMVGSSGRQRVQNACFTNFYLALPPEDDLLTIFNDLTSDNFKKITQNSLQSRELAKTRDVLLPKLLSGEFSLAKGDISAEVCV